MTGCKPCNTLVCAKTQLSLFSSDPLADATEFRKLVGSLQYLTFTCPDIAYTHVMQFMGAPRSLHLIAAKRIFRYLKGSLDLSLHFRRSQSPPMLIVAPTLVALLLGLASSWVPI